MAFWNRHKKRQQEELAEVEKTLHQVMARESTIGPTARPWRERRTTPPPGYEPVQWDRWKIKDASPDAVRFVVPEMMVGAVFPGDQVEINGEWRQVLKVHVEYDEPVIEFYSSLDTWLDADLQLKKSTPPDYWGAYAFGGPEYLDHLIIDQRVAPELYDAIVVGDYIQYNSRWRRARALFRQIDAIWVIIDVNEYSTRTAST